jgi:His/Glu/Gln/Arg/opine family amino acid ABC transporter permease subunit
MNEWVRAVPVLPEILRVLLGGAVTTIEVTFGGFVVAVALGLLLALCLTYPARLPRIAIRAYIEFFRGIPVLTQLFVLYFGLAQIGIRLSPLTVSVIGFGLNGGAYMTEIFRAGLESVSRGQTEAAFMIGMTRWQSLRYVVVPQAMRVSLPPMANFAVGLLKDSSLASAVAAPELSFYARNLVTQTYLSGPIYVLVAIMYICMSVPLSRLSQYLEGRFGRGRRL